MTLGLSLALFSPLCKAAGNHGLRAPLPAVSSNGWARFASGPGAYGYVGLGLTLPLIRDGGNGSDHFWRTSEALSATIIVTEGLKHLTRVPRPDNGEPDSFPSGHASTAFAIATMQASFRPKEAALWYLGAAVIADSRLVLNRHRLTDVFAGAGLGFLIARAELSSRNGWVVRPFLRDEGDQSFVTGAIKGPSGWSFSPIAGVGRTFGVLAVRHF